MERKVEAGACRQGKGWHRTLSRRTSHKRQRRTLWSSRAGTNALAMSVSRGSGAPRTRGA